MTRSTEKDDEQIPLLQMWTCCVECLIPLETIKKWKDELIDMDMNNLDDIEIPGQQEYLLRLFRSILQTQTQHPYLNNFKKLKVKSTIPFDNYFNVEGYLKFVEVCDVVDVKENIDALIESCLERVVQQLPTPFSIPLFYETDYGNTNSSLFLLLLLDSYGWLVKNSTSHCKNEFREILSEKDQANMLRIFNTALVKTECDELFSRIKKDYMRAFGVPNLSLGDCLLSNKPEHLPWFNLLQKYVHPKLIEKELGEQLRDFHKKEQNVMSKNTMILLSTVECVPNKKESSIIEIIYSQKKGIEYYSPSDIDSLKSGCQGCVQSVIDLRDSTVYMLKFFKSDMSMKDYAENNIYQLIHLNQDSEFSRHVCEIYEYGLVNYVYYSNIYHSYTRMPLLKYDLQSYMNDHTFLETLGKFEQLLKGIKAFHMSNIVHTNLTLPNVLLDFDDQVKIIDFSQGEIDQDDFQVKKKQDIELLHLERYCDQ